MSKNDNKTASPMGRPAGTGAVFSEKSNYSLAIERFQEYLNALRQTQGADIGPSPAPEHQGNAAAGGQRSTAGTFTDTPPTPSVASPFSLPTPQGDAPAGTLPPQDRAQPFAAQLQALQNMPPEQQAEMLYAMASSLVDFLYRANQTNHQDPITAAKREQDVILAQLCLTKILPFVHPDLREMADTQLIRSYATNGMGKDEIDIAITDAQNQPELNGKQHYVATHGLYRLLQHFLPAMMVEAFEHAIDSTQEQQLAKLSREAAKLALIFPHDAANLAPVFIELSMAFANPAANPSEGVARLSELFTQIASNNPLPNASKYLNAAATGLQELTTLLERLAPLAPDTALAQELIQLSSSLAQGAQAAAAPLQLQVTQHPVEAPKKTPTQPNTGDQNIQEKIIQLQEQLVNQLDAAQQTMSELDVLEAQLRDKQSPRKHQEPIQFAQHQPGPAHRGPGGKIA